MPTLWLLVTLRTETPEEDETLRMSLLPLEPWMLKVTVLDVALMPATVPLSWSRPVVRAEAEDQTASLPGTPVPVMLPPPAVPIYREPLASAYTGPLDREEMVVEPLEATWNREEPVEEETINRV